MHDQKRMLQGHPELVALWAFPLRKAPARFFKRCFDLAFSVPLFIFIFSWLWPLLALFIKLTSPGPVFFKQERWGVLEKPFSCFKFRSMIKESRDIDENGRFQQAKRNDPRVTAIGRILRSNNLDELAQFVNVLKGEMSIVGPRPHPIPMNLEIKCLIPDYRLRHSIKPGITGWAQVNGWRGETSQLDLLQRRVEADIWYIENWSPWLDIKIIGRSLWLMLKGDPSAY